MATRSRKAKDKEVGNGGAVSSRGGRVLKPKEILLPGEEGQAPKEKAPAKKAGEASDAGKGVGDKRKRKGAGRSEVADEREPSVAGSEETVLVAEKRRKEPPADADDPWNLLAEPLRIRMVKWAGFVDGCLTKESDILDEAKTLRAQLQAQLKVRRLGLDAAILQLKLFENVQEEGISKAGSRAGRSRAPSVVDMGESRALPDDFLMTFGGKPSASRKETLAEETAEEKEEPEGPKNPYAFLGTWDTSCLVLRDMAKAVGNKTLLDAKLEDWSYKPSSQLVGATAQELLLCKFLKKMEAFCLRFVQDSELAQKRVHEAIAGNAETARIVRTHMSGTILDPEYFKSGVAGDMAKEVRLEQLRLSLKKTRGTDVLSGMEARVKKPAELSAYGEKTLKEEEKLQKKAPALEKGRVSQDRSTPAGGSKASGGGGSAKNGKQNAASGSDEVCFACNQRGHKWWQGKCAQGRERERQDPATVARLKAQERRRRW
jgi:hypothetical protein